MEIRFLGKNIKVSKEMQSHMNEKLTKLEHYAPRLIESHVVLKKEKYMLKAEVTLLAKNLRAYGEAQSKENVFAAFDSAVIKVEKQLKKYREKVKSHHKEHGDMAISPKVRTAESVNNSEEYFSDSRPKIVRSKEFEVKPMSAEESSLQLEISKNPFLVFFNASTKMVNVIYKRPDGNHGLIEPVF